MCTLPNSGGKKLADFFKSRNPDTIAEGMRSIVAGQAEVVEDMMERYNTAEKVDAEDIDTLMKGMNSLFGNANKLHAIVKPRESGVNIHLGINAGAGSSVSISQQEPREMAAAVIRELEQKNPGVEITDDMVRDALLQIESNQKAIEGEIIDG